MVKKERDKEKVVEDVREKKRKLKTGNDGKKKRKVT